MSNVCNIVSELTSGFAELVVWGCYGAIYCEIATCRILKGTLLN